MKAKPSFQFYPSDWLRDPGLRSCSLGARGLWIDILSFMHEAEPYGHLLLNGRPVDAITLARMVGSDVRTVRRLLSELEAAGVFSKTEPGTIFSRRMVRDQELRERRAQYGYLSEKHPDVPKRKDSEKDTFKDTLPPSIEGSFGGSPSSSSSSSSSKEEEKRAGSTSSSPASSSTKRKLQLSDEEFVAALRKNPAYKHLDLDREFGKMDAWLLTPKGRRRTKTQKFVVSWLNKAADEQRPMATTATLLVQGRCRDRQANGRHSQPCPNPSVPGEQYCSDHLPIRQRIAAHLASGKAS